MVDREIEGWLRTNQGNGSFCCSCTIQVFRERGALTWTLPLCSGVHDDQAKLTVVLFPFFVSLCRFLQDRVFAARLRLTPGGRETILLKRGWEASLSNCALFVRGFICYFLWFLISHGFSCFFHVDLLFLLGGKENPLMPVF